MITPATIKLAAYLLVISLLVGSGIWFRGVLADNKEMKTTIKAQEEEIQEACGEIERMNKQDAADQILFTSVESAKQKLANDLDKKMKDLRTAREKLNEATRNCLDAPLPADYLERLP